MVAVGRRAEAQEVVVSTLAMVVLALLRVAVFPLQTLLLLVVQVVHDLARQPEPLAVQAARPGQPEPLVLHLLPVDYLGKVAAAVAVVLLAQAAQAVQAVVALVVEAVAQHAVHTLLALVV